MIRRLLSLLGGFAGESALLFVRNIVIARLLSIEDYGIASTFALTAMLVEMVSQLGLKQLIMQAAEGDDPAFQAGLHGFQALRGLTNAAAVLVLAEPIAWFLGVPEIAWAYRVVALVPLLQGFFHLDPERMQRQSRYRAAVLSPGIAAALSLVSLWPLHALLGDWRIMLCALLIQIGGQVLLSHLFAERPWRARLDGALMRRSLRFGWPLLLNGLLIYAAMNGEKLVAGRELGLAALGILTMGVTLTLNPLLIGTRVVQSLMLPRLSRSEGPAFLRLAGVTCDGGAAVGMALMAGTVLVGPPFVSLVLGAKFEPLIPLLTPLAAVQALRALRIGPTFVAMSRARTTLPMLSNLPRVAAIGLAWIVLHRGGDMLDLVLLAVAGEVAGTAAAFALMARIEGAPARWLPIRGLLPVLLVAATLIADHARWHGAGWGAPVGDGLPERAATGALLLLALAMIAWVLVISRQLLRAAKAGGGA